MAPQTLQESNSSGSSDTDMESDGSHEESSDEDSSLGQNAVRNADNGITDTNLLRLQISQFDPITIVVRVGSGENSEQWTIHKSLLTHRSAFFASALSGCFVESTTNNIELVEDDPKAFMYLVRWVYTGNPEIEPNEPLTAIHAWALGEKLQCPTFQDHAMRQVVAYFKKEHLVEDTMRLVYEISPPESKLRKFALDKFVWD
ncbi:MAG: hypothetical protein Q9169_004811 [Polycauliona sp. 2 TL-2023]